MNEVSQVQPETRVEDVPGLSPAARHVLVKEGFPTVESLVMHFPARHEDRRRMDFKGFSPGETPVCHHVSLLKTRVLRFGGRGGVFEAVVEATADNLMHQQLTLRWFNMAYLQRVLAVGMELMIYGRIKEVKARLLMDHPDYEVVRGEGSEDEEDAMHTGRIVPVYRLRGALKQKTLRAAIWKTLEQLEESAFRDILPRPRAGGEFDHMTRWRALRTLHQPPGMEELEKGRRYLALEEFYLLQLRAVRRKQQFKQHQGFSQAPEGRLLADFLKALPFSLTPAQQRCLDEIREDMAAPRPMNRLLHGDVGSGKTVVALAAALLAVEAGRQAVFMAPTQILAEQHFQNALRWLRPLGVRVALRTGDRSAGDTEGTENTDDLSLEARPAEALANAPIAPWAGAGPPHLVIGTHALLYEGAALAQPGLIVIDEQHKFGVAQRARLITRGVAPDVLVMTATPIPRTLSLTLYGDLDVSTIDQRPKERGRIVTAVREAGKLDEVVKFVQGKLDEGRQCYVVYPLIEESEKLEAGAAVTGFQEWTMRLAPHATGLLHGRMDPAQKDMVMQRFRDGSLKVLVSTTVIEVGVDVPNASLMIIHDAGRFGLAQLHQLRGRIGRGAHTSYAVLFVAKGDKETRERLRILEETNDGFLIAEEDLRRRGPGDVLGQAQSGQSGLRFGALLGDTRLVTTARRLAERTLAHDPELTSPANQLLRLLAGGEEFTEGTMQ